MRAPLAWFASRSTVQSLLPRQDKLVSLQKKYHFRLKVFQNKPFVIGTYPFEKTALASSNDVYAQRFSVAISFPETILGNRQRRTWHRLTGEIESSETLSAFDSAASYAEGYAQALVDSDQIDISIERDLLIIATVDAWRCTRIDPNTSTYL